MTGKTHIIGGLAASLALANVTNYEPVLLVGAGVVGALIPDICHGGSTIGRTLPVVSKLVNMLFGHRSFTHSLLFLLLVGFALKSFVVNESVGVGLLIGMISHIVLDMATKNGVKLFFPFKVRIRFPLTTRTGGTVVYVVFAALSLLSVYFGYGAMEYYL